MPYISGASVAAILGIVVIPVDRRQIAPTLRLRTVRGRVTAPCASSGLYDTAAPLCDAVRLLLSHLREEQASRVRALPLNCSNGFAIERSTSIFDGRWTEFEA